MQVNKIRVTAAIAYAIDLQWGGRTIVQFHEGDVLDIVQMADKETQISMDAAATLLEQEKAEPLWRRRRMPEDTQKRVPTLSNIVFFKDGRAYCREPNDFYFTAGNTDESLMFILNEIRQMQGTGMRWESAYSAMRSGSIVRRKSQPLYLVRQYGTKFVMQDGSTYRFTPADEAATDWEIVPEAPNV